MRFAKNPWVLNDLRLGAVVGKCARSGAPTGSGKTHVVYGQVSALGVDGPLATSRTELQSVEKSDVRKWLADYLSTFAAPGRDEPRLADAVAYYGVPFLLRNDTQCLARMVKPHAKLIRKPETTTGPRSR